MATMKVKSTLDSRGYKRGIDEMRRQNSKFGKSLSTIKGKMKMLAAGFTVAAIVAGLKRITAAAIESASELYRMSVQAGVSAESLQKLGRPAMDAGEDLDTVRDALGAIRTAQGEVIRGDEGMRKEFEMLGISFDEIVNMEVDELFARIGQAMKESGSDAARFSALAKIIGEGDAIKLREAFEASADGLEKMRMEAGALTEMQAAQIESSRRWAESQKRYIVNFWAGSIAKAIAYFKGWEGAADVMEERQEKREKSAKRRRELADMKEKERTEKQARALAEAHEKRKGKIEEATARIRESVTIDIETDSLRRIGGVAGAQVKDSLRNAMRQTEILEQIREYEASLPAIEENTAKRGLA